MLKKKAQDLYMRGEDKEMAALMDDHYAGKFKSSYDPDLPWSKGKKNDCSFLASSILFLLSNLSPYI